MKTGASKAFTRQRAQIWLRADQEPHEPVDTDRARPRRLDGVGEAELFKLA